MQIVFQKFTLPNTTNLQKISKFKFKFEFEFSRLLYKTSPAPGTFSAKEIALKDGEDKVEMGTGWILRAGPGFSILLPGPGRAFSSAKI